MINQLFIILLGQVGGVLLDCWVYDWWPWDGFVWIVLLASGPTCHQLKEIPRLYTKGAFPRTVKIPPAVEPGGCIFVAWCLELNLFGFQSGLRNPNRYPSHSVALP